jgi:hypothetical protein
MLHQARFRIDDINNAVLKTQNAMPQKDNTSDGTGTFSMGRQSYIELANAINKQTPIQKINKKWFGNRDASQVTTNRRTTGIGKGSLNANNTPISFTTNNDNSVKDALSRVRGGGAIVPPKCNHATQLTSRFI